MVLHCTVMHFTALHYPVLHCTVVHYTVLHYSILHYSEMHYRKLQYNELHYNTVYCTTVNFTTVNCIYIVTKKTTKFCHVGLIFQQANNFKNNTNFGTFLKMKFAKKLRIYLKVHKITLERTSIMYDSTFCIIPGPSNQR